ncbi:MAG: GNAT family N-acetyltransferase [Thermoplasmatota archaeon]
MEGSFEEFPVIDCGDIILRRFRMEDAEDLARNINHRGISRYTLNIPYPYGPDDAIEFMAKNKDWYDAESDLNLAICKKEDDRVIGGIGLMKIEWQNKASEIGYWLGREHWGRGITPKAVRGMVKYGFKELGLHRISSVIFSPNKRSRRVMEKSGFEIEGILKDRYILEDEYVDGVMYAILDKD